jgi:predicted phage terminase large subunit-like protein
MTNSTRSLKPDRRRAREEKALRLARRSLTTYKRFMWRRYAHAEHLEQLDRALESVARYAETGGAQGIGRLLVMMPPRHGKTLTISRMFPAWYLGRNPDHRVIMASYGSSLAKKNSRFARTQLLMPRYQALFPDTRLDPRSASAEAWDIADREGGLDAMGVGGAVTGKGANVLIWDDPVKNREEAESETIRDKVWDSWADDFYTRLEPGGAVVGVMTRWHMDDWMGRLLKLEADKWHILRMPALAEPDDLLGRAVGTALWPARYPVPVLADIRGVQGEYGFSALYQQTPTPAEGGLFKRASFKLLQRLPGDDELEYVVRYWDLAMSEKDSADYSVGVKLARGHDGRTKVLDVARRQLEWGDVVPFMAETALRDGPGVIIGFEEKGYMSRAGQGLAADTRLHQYGIFGYPKDKDKRTNALPFAARVALEMVDVYDGHWTRDYLDELCSFPFGAHDDQVDASAGAYEMLGMDAYAGGLHHAAEYEIGAGAY